MIDEILARCSEMGLPVIGKISFEPQIVEVMLQCKSSVEWVPETDAAKEVYAQVVNNKIN
jgi:MinD superfamily P-loop ATPase